MAGRVLVCEAVVGEAERHRLVGGRLGQVSVLATRRPFGLLQGAELPSTAARLGVGVGAVVVGKRGIGLVDSRRLDEPLSEGDRDANRGAVLGDADQVIGQIAAHIATGQAAGGVDLAEGLRIAEARPRARPDVDASLTDAAQEEVGSAIAVAVAEVRLDVGRNARPWLCCGQAVGLQEPRDDVAARFGGDGDDVAGAVAVDVRQAHQVVGRQGSLVDGPVERLAGTHHRRQRAAGRIVEQHVGGIGEVEVGEQGTSTSGPGPDRCRRGEAVALRGAGGQSAGGRHVAHQILGAVAVVVGQGDGAVNRPDAPHGGLAEGLLAVAGAHGHLAADLVAAHQVSRPVGGDITQDDILVRAKTENPVKRRAGATAHRESEALGALVARRVVCQ